MKEVWTLDDLIEVEESYETIYEHSKKYRMDPKSVVTQLLDGRSIKQIFNKRIREQFGIVEVAKPIRKTSRRVQKNVLPSKEGFENFMKQKGL